MHSRPDDSFKLSAFSLKSRNKIAGTGDLLTMVTKIIIGIIKLLVFKTEFSRVVTDPKSKFDS